MFWKSELSGPKVPSPYLHSLVKVHSHHFLHAVFDHLGREEVGLPFLVHGDFPEIFQENGANGFRWVGHVNWPIVADHLAEVGEGPTVIQMEVAGKDTNPRWVLKRTQGVSISAQLHFGFYHMKLVSEPVF